jgi:hypothetical protein
VTDQCSHVITAVATEHNDALYMAAQNLGRLVAGGKQPFPVIAVLRTQTTRNENALLVPAGGTWNNDATSVLDVMRTRTTTESEVLWCRCATTTPPSRSGKCSTPSPQPGTTTAC